jgi:hypothetical protein
MPGPDEELRAALAAGVEVIAQAKKRGGVLAFDATDAGVTMRALDGELTPLAEPVVVLEDTGGRADQRELFTQAWQLVAPAGVCATYHDDVGAGTWERDVWTWESWDEVD